MAVAGSSPLTRGKPLRERLARLRVGLIPAHAGKTSRRRCRPWRAGAHPRSRGENGSHRRGTVKPKGSSPLTRGKRVFRRSFGVLLGLIPAHAGKTAGLLRLAVVQEAHPRSRGENLWHDWHMRTREGSSPLTRGKHQAPRPHRSLPGLIPAHAGKTAPRTASQHSSRAHPRSRGENLRCASNCEYAQGSSPLTRGKREGLRGASWGRGLIPAHAGKTLPDLRFYRADRSDLGKP